MLQTVAVDFRDGSTNIVLDIPSFCPHCGNIMSPYTLQGFSEHSQFDDDVILGVITKCTIDECQKFFALEFKVNPQTREKKLIDYTYRPPIKVTLPENIEKISEKFVEIYSQATQAEADKLNQIAGVGYRKATEFLIKDYAIRNNHTDKEKIEKMLLGKVINEYLNDFPKLQNLAKASTWIGNDETHYVRRHEDKDINDMKAFILSAAQFIAADYDADLALDFVSDDNS